MLIPGLPIVGAQQDVVKPKRGVQPTVESEPVHEALEESAVERRQRDQERTPERRRGRRRKIAARQQAPVVEEQPAELPTMGLLVDIEV